VTEVLEGRLASRDQTKPKGSTVGVYATLHSNPEGSTASRPQYSSST
jgi:hypothetical protein